MRQDSRGSLRGLLRGGAGIAVAMGVMNVATYGFTILAARLLGPSEYGALASLMGLLLVVNVVSLGLQATGARRVAAAPAHRVEIEGGIMSATIRSAAAVGLLCLLLTPVIAWALDLDQWWAAAMVAATAVPLTLMGGYAGVLQGEERWRPLGGIYVGMGLGRVLCGVAAILISPTAFAGMAGVALGAWLPPLVGALTLGHLGPRQARADVRRRGGAVLHEIVGNSHALLAFFALSNLDVVLARALLEPREAGLYAGGLILTKAVLFLPQFVSIVTFPRMAATASRTHTWLKGLAIVSVIGLAAVLGTLGLDRLAVAFIGGPAYDAMRDHLWLFATLGTLLAMVHLMVYEVVARQHRTSVLVLWAGIPAVVSVAYLADSGADLVLGVAFVYTAVLAVLLAVALLRPVRHGRPA